MQVVDFAKIWQSFLRRLSFTRLALLMRMRCPFLCPLKYTLPLPQCARGIGNDLFPKISDSSYPGVTQAVPQPHAKILQALVSTRCR